MIDLLVGLWLVYGCWLLAYKVLATSRPVRPDQDDDAPICWG